MLIRPYHPFDRAEWLRMRCALWPTESLEELAAELEAWVRGDETVVFFAEADDGTLAGFVEVSIRTEAPACITNRVGFLEGWYVKPEFRRRGVGRALSAAAESWAREKGCVEMASDTNEEYPISPAAHRAVGYLQVGESLNFAKRLD